MVYFTILFTLYVVVIITYALFKEYTNKDHKAWQVAFRMWSDSLAKTGYPRHASGAWMTYWELADYFDASKEKESFIAHVKKNWGNYERIPKVKRGKQTVKSKALRN